MSKSDISQIQTTVNSCARLISGCIRSTPVPNLLHEAKILPIQLALNIKLAIQLAKWKSDPQSWKTHKMSEERVTTRLKSIPDWREKAINFKNEHIKQIVRVTKHDKNDFQPWKENNNLIILTNLDYEILKKDETSNEILKTKFGQIKKNLPPFTDELWTDGSKMTNSSGGAFIYKNRNGWYSEYFSIQLAESSYRTEATSLNKGLEYIKRNSMEELGNNKKRRLACFIDSMSVISSIKNFKKSSNTITYKIMELLESLYNKYKQIYIIWAPSHVGIPQNQQADMLAKRGALIKKTKHPKLQKSHFNNLHT